MLRALAAVTLALLCVYAGFRSSARLRRRALLLRAAVAAQTRLLAGAAHTRVPLPQLLRGCEAEDAPVSFTAVAAAVERGCTVREALLDAMRAADMMVDGRTADREAYGAVLAFADALGAESRALVYERASLAADVLRARCEAAEAAYREKGRVYRSLGLLMGAAAAVLLL